MTKNENYNKIKYDDKLNRFVTKGITSINGNTYYSALSLSSKIYIYLNFGIGYTKIFLNSIEVYILNNKSLIGAKSYYRQQYSESKIKEEVKEIIFNKLIPLTQIEGTRYSKKWIEDVVNRIVNETYLNQLKILNDIKNNNSLIN